MLPHRQEGDAETTNGEHIKVDEFKDVIVNALTSPTSEEENDLKTKRAAYEIVEACFAQIDKHFQTAYYEGGSFFLTEEETNRIQHKVVPLAREDSVEEQLVGDPSDVLGSNPSAST